VIRGEWKNPERFGEVHTGGETKKKKPETRRGDPPSQHTPKISSA